MPARDSLRSLVLSVLILVVLLLAWHIATIPTTGAQVVDEEYAKLVGAQAATGQKSAFPTPLDVGKKLVEQLSDPFYDRGPNDKGIGIQLAWSISRVGLGFLLAAVVAIPLGFVIGMSRVVFKALDPFMSSNPSLLWPGCRWRCSRLRTPTFPRSL